VPFFYFAWEENSGRSVSHRGVARRDLTPLEGWLSRSLNRKSKKGTKDKKDAEGIEMAVRWMGLRDRRVFLKAC
jgi:hypothetical protein